MLRYMVYEDFNLYVLIPQFILNTNLNNITHSHVFKNISSSSKKEIITKKVLLKDIVLKTPHELFWKSYFPLNSNIEIFTPRNT